MFLRNFRSILLVAIIVACSFGTSFVPQQVFAANPTLTLVGGTSLSLPKKATGITVSGSYAYMSFQDQLTNGFRIVDISNPASPSVVGGTDLSFAGNVQGHTTSGNYAYVFDFQTLKIVDISSPSSPAFVAGGSVSLPAADPNGIVVSGNYAYVITGSATATDRFRIIDITDKENPSVVGGSGLSIPGEPSDIEISGNYVYLSLKQDSAGTAGLRVVDVSNPASPSIVGGTALTLPGEEDTPVYSDLSGNYLYLGYSMTTANSMFRIVDITTPTSPTIAGGTGLDTGTAMFGVNVSGTNAYVIESDGIFERLAALDVSNVASSVRAGNSYVVFAGDLGDATLTSNSTHVFVAMNRATAGTDALKIVQVSTASSTGSTNTDFTPPDAPTKLIAISDGKTATLTWADPTASDLARIEVLRNNGGTTPVDGGNILEVFGAGVKTYTDITVTPGQEYTYQLRAKDKSGNASISETISVKVQKAESVTAPVVVPAPVVTPVPVVLPTVPVAPAFSAKDNFLQNGSLATNTFGSGERAVFWREFTELYGREPFVAELDLMSNGQIHERNPELESRLMNQVLPLWQKLTGKKSLTNISDREQQIFDVMVYRLRFPRDIEQEKLGLTKFIRLFQYLPKTPIDWAAVRVLGYIK